MKLEQAARQALEALENGKTWIDIITPLREALGESNGKRNLDGNSERIANSNSDNRCASMSALAEQAEQKPVAWVEVERGIPMFMDFAEDYKPNINNGIAPLYAAPVRTKDLTDDDLLEALKSVCSATARLPQGLKLFARAVIAADRDKNK